MQQRMAKRLETVKFLTGDETARLFKAIDSKRDRAMFLLAYRHGLRASEVGLLRTDDVDFKAQRVRVHRAKGSIGGVHPMQPDEVKAVKAYLRARKASPWLFTTIRGTPVGRKLLDALMKRYCESAGIDRDKAHFHSLKHSIATGMLDAGADIMFVNDWLGHAQIANTLIYAKLTSKTRDDRAFHLFRQMPRYG